jgi:selenide,water dikinase
MPSQTAQKPRVVLIGGGHTHALVLKEWGLNPTPDIELTVINPSPHAAYSGMLPGFIAGHYTREDMELDIEALAHFAGARCIIGSAIGFDLDESLIHLDSGDTLAFDYASVDIGITSDLPTIDGFDVNGICAKPLGPFAQSWQQFLQNVDAGNTPPQAAIIGGGVAGVEVALAIAHALRGHANAQVSLIDRSKILTEMSRHSRNIALKALQKYGINTLPHTAVSRVAPDEVTLSTQTHPSTLLASHFTVSTAGAHAYGWPAHSTGTSKGLETTHLETQNGFICVDTYLRSSDPRVFAVGDCAHMTKNPRPKAGVYAVRQAPVLFENLRHAAAGHASNLHAYTPQKRYLKLMSLGERRAIADKTGIQISGRLIWRWKDWIDRSFMHKFKDL